MLLYVRGSVVDLASDCPISLNYDLNSDRDLSSFTTTYSKELVLPLTRGNRVIFEHPSIGISQGSYDYYILADDGSKVDEGSLVIDRVDGSGVHCHLYGSLVDLNTKLSGLDSLSDCIVDGYMLDADNVSHPVNFYNQQTGHYDKTSVLVKADNFNDYASTNVGVQISGDDYGERKLLYFSPTYIGVPKDFDASHIWSYNNNDPIKIDLGRDYTVLEAAGRPALSCPQYRPYQLQPFVRTMMLFNNVVAKADNYGYDLSISNDAKNLLLEYDYLTPKLSEVYTNTEDVLWSYPDTKVSTTSGTVVTRTGYTTALSLRNLFAGRTMHFSLGDSTIASYYIASVSDGTATKKYLICSNFEDSYCGITLNEDFYKGIQSAYSLTSYDKAYAWDGVVKTPFSSGELSTTYTVSISTVKIVFHKARIGKRAVIDSVTTYSYAMDVCSGNPVSVDDITVEFSVSDTVDGAGYMIFSYESYFQRVAKPWDIVKRICKKFNIRLKAKSLKEYEFVTGREYYDANLTDISSILDFTDEVSEAFVFPYKKILFQDEATDASWVKGYSSLDSGKLYGSKTVNNSLYPVESEKKWFDNPLKYTTSVAIKHGNYGMTTVITDYPMLEACDKDSNEVLVSDCIVYHDVNNLRKYYVTDDHKAIDDDAGDAEQSYYLFSDLNKEYTDLPYSSLGRKIFNTRIVNSGLSIPDGSMCEQRCNYADSRFNPNGIIGGGYLSDYFLDVLDSVGSSTYECGVFFKEIDMNIHDFVQTIFSFNNAYWVVSSISSYDPMSPEPTRVKFIKVRDLGSYLPNISATITASVSSFGHGSVSPASQTVRIGRAAAVTATPDSGYMFVRWELSSAPGTAVSTSATYSFHVSGDTSLVAVFGVAPTTYHLKVIGEQYGTVTTLIGLGIERVGDFELDVEENTPLVFSWEVKPAYEGFYKFDSWHDNISGEDIDDNPYEDEMNRDITIVAHSQPIEYSDFYAGTSYGKLSGTVAGETFTNQREFTKSNISGAYNVSVTWSADGSGKELTEWKVYIGGTEVSPRPGGNPYVLEGVNDDVYILPVVRDPQSYVFTANATVSGSTLSGEVAGEHYDEEVSISEQITGIYSVQLTWNAGTSGKVFSKWHVAHGGGTDDYDTPTLSLPDINYSANVTVVAREPVAGFKLTSSSGPSLESFAVTYADDTPYVLGTVVEAGTNLHITARAMEGDFIECWSDTIAGDVIVEYPLDFWINLQANVNLNANISQGERMHVILPEEGDGEYTIPYFQDYYDAVTLNGGDNWIDLPSGMFVDLYCYDPQDPLYEFDYWYTQDEEEIRTQFVSVEVTSGLEYEAYYKLKQSCQLSLGSVTGGSITVKADNVEITSFPATVRIGAVITATNVPSQGYVFQHYTINGVQTSLPYTMTGDASIGAVFQESSTFSGFKLYDGTIINDGGTFYLWERGSVNPIWIMTNASYDNISVSVDSNKFSAYRKVDNLMVIADVSGANGNTQYTADVTVVVGGVSHVLHVHLMIEYQGSSFLYNRNGNVFGVIDVPANGTTSDYEFFNGEGWYGRNGSDNPPVDAFLPTISSGYGAIGNEWASDRTFGQDNLEDYVVTKTISGMPYSSYSLFDVNRDYLNLCCSMTFPSNSTGNTKYYLMKVSSSFFHDGQGNEVPSVLVFVQSSN